MKKYFILTLLVVASVLPSGVFAQAQSLARPTINTNCVTLTRNLVLGSRDAGLGGEVFILQNFLQNRGYMTSAPTGYFGVETFAAVKLFQGGKAALPSTGYVGAQTRAYIQALTCGKPDATPLPQQPDLCPNGKTLISNCQNYPVGPYAETLCPNGNTLASNCATAPGTPVSGDKAMSITVTQPTAGKYITTGTVTRITWKSKDVSYVKIKLRKGNDTYNGPGGVIADQVYAPLGYYDWNVPTTLPNGSDYSVRVIESGGQTHDDSDSIFYIVTGEKCVSGSGPLAPGQVRCAAIQPIASLEGNPVLTLNYDSSQQESRLTAIAYVNVAAGSNAINIFTGHAKAWFHLTNLNRPNDGFLSSDTYVTGGAGLTPRTNTYGQTYFTLPANTTTRLKVTTTVNPQQMFAGMYVAVLKSFSYADLSQPDSGLALDVPVNRTNVVTIIGEKSPYIDSITQSVKAGDVLVIRGARLNPATSILVDGSAISPAGLVNITSGTKLYFTVPTKWASGQHYVEVSNSFGKSNRAGFAVTDSPVSTKPTVSFDDDPKLTLNYDASRKESQLTAIAHVKIKAGPEQVNIYNTKGVFSLVDSKGSGDNLNNQSVTVTGLNGAVAGLDSNGRKYYVVPANNAVTFKVVRLINPQSVFAGSYLVSLKNLSYTASSQPENILTLDNIPTNRSNSVTVIGERTPYISYVTMSVKVGDMLTINGQRLFDGTVIRIDGREVNPLGRVNSTDGKKIYFSMPNSTPGQHYVEVSNSFGNSNRAGFTVTSSTQPLTTLSSTIIGSKSNYVAGQEIKFSVKAIASDGNSGAAAKGFNVQYSLKDGRDIDGSTIGGVFGNAVYNNSTGNWDVTAVAPSDTSKTYVLLTSFYCSSSRPGYCDAELRPAQISKAFIFTVTDSAAQPSITVTSPNGGERYVLGSTRNIFWTKTADSGSHVKIMLMKGEGLVGNISASAANTGSFTWVVPTNLIIGSNYKIKVQSTTDANVFGISKYNFSVINSTAASAAVFNAVNQDDNIPSVDVQSNPSCLALINDVQYRDNDALNVGAISKLQNFLRDQGFLSSESSGYFGDQTFIAVKVFQANNGIAKTGYVGAQTRAKIQEASCR